ncbi:nuclear transport factor 2 family protein [Litoribrevibacter albus]|uniref:SnoaL-like domain-containing protein n=1 Tax=Litoribrevibacter albus TaxID=1473156 RepID=A0AA37S8X4_9GAMM|nr:nuclear transport factor 2 family protein [Litoribrevibacter albus]GLQ30227.1 hypothetical protein GCM10007876_07050 [Litoribrevibacter albus]
MKKITTALVFLMASMSLFAQGNDKLTIDLKALQKPNWSEQEQKNAELITDFIQKLMNNHDFDYVLEHYNDGAYVQHNRNLPDKVTGLVGFLEEFVEDYPDYTYDVKHIYADGEYITFHSHATLNKEDRGNDQQGMNIIDTWRIKDGKIVEHWDSIQALDGFMRFYSLMNGGDIRNDNGVF